MVAVTMAPEEDRFEASLFVFTVAEINVPPQVRPVATAKPVGVTVTICTSFEVQVT